MRSTIEGYTAEAGVRGLSRCLAAVCRHVAVQVVQRREQQEQQQGGACDALVPLPEMDSGGAGNTPPPPLPQPVFHGVAGVAAASATAPAVSAAAFRRQPAVLPAAAPELSPRSSSGVHVHQSDALTPAGRVRLWAQLLPLSAIDPASGAASAAAAAEVSHAVSGYPWPQLPRPPRSRRSVSSTARPLAAAAAPAADCACASRKQASGWFGWLRWARHDSHAEQAGAAELEAGVCTCSGSCGDADCCCKGGAQRRQLASGPPADWGEHRDAGTAADTASWEASWRSAAQCSAAHHHGPAEAAPLLCGPGSMQVLRPSGRGAPAWTPPPGAALPATAAAGSQLRAQQQAQQPVLADERFRGGLLAAEALQPALPAGLQQQEQQQIVVDTALIEAVLGPKRFEGHNSAGWRDQPWGGLRKSSA